MYALIDIDDVTLDWTYMFDKWVRLTKEYSGPPIYELPDNLSTLFYPSIYSEFNSSEFFQKLPLIDYAKLALTEISNAYDIVFISSCGIEYTEDRHRNLQLHFPELKYECLILPLHADKTEYINSYKPKLYIDDNFDNCVSASNIEGCQTYLYSAPYNSDLIHPNIIKLKSWKEFLQNVKK